MKYLYRLSGVILLLLLIGSCGPDHSAGEQAARAGVESTVAHLPRPQEFEWLKVYYAQNSMTVQGDTCYYGIAYVILGTSLPPSKAINVYADHLRTLGWTYDQSQFETSKSFLHELNERVVVESLDPGLDPGEENEYRQFKATYPTVIHARVMYYLPAREGC